MTLTAISPRLAINTLENTSYGGRVNDSNARPADSGARFSAVTWVSETGSTNADLAEKARRGEGEQALVADHQRAGRGRLDRTWEAPPETSVLMSVLVKPNLPPSRVPLLTLAMGQAVCEAASGLGASVGLKWPNDVVSSVDGDAVSKVAGILAEAVWDDSRVAAVVVGVGINVNWPDGFPDHLAADSVSLGELTGNHVDRGSVVTDVLAAFGRRVGDLESPGGDVRLVETVRPLLVTLGRRVRVELADEVVVGRAVDISADATLIVDTGSTRREIVAGDIRHLRMGE